MERNVLKPLHWVGSSKDDIKLFPGEVRENMGFALFQAQSGLKHRDAKPFRGLGTGVLEVVSRHDRNTFRAVYTVRFKEAVYVLHAFQKKARKGIKTAKQDVDLISRRLKAAQAHYEENHGKD
ncbi:MAG: type II toxin-antitoxin system RelE/ParE family toxin [Alphaproteobacteria bacterium]|nr:type II toxin-antitoxin system RelE/ParE family toxin [Alphaproteobacteria bacterium]